MERAMGTWLRYCTRTEEKSILACFPSTAMKTVAPHWVDRDYPFSPGDYREARESHRDLSAESVIAVRRDCTVCGSFFFFNEGPVESPFG